ncbi:MAG TPA: Cu(I)-responsive transcriptional regulator [Aliidongia sp.]|nr:Cu(I)-responsive transcriptional regulator [Aliidongia sp.]
MAIRTAEILTIGEASAASGVSAKMIRYYESVGLIRPATRTESNYRTYDGKAVETLRFVARARHLGFSMDEIGRLLALWQDRGRASADVKALAVKHIDELEQRIAAMTAMKATLEHLAERCHGDNRPDCPIIESIASGDCCH